MKPHRAGRNIITSNKRQQAGQKLERSGLLDLAILKVLANYGTHFGLTPLTITSLLPKFKIDLNELTNPKPFARCIAAHLQQLQNQGMVETKNDAWLITSQGRSKAQSDAESFKLTSLVTLEDIKSSIYRDLSPDLREEVATLKACECRKMVKTLQKWANELTEFADKLEPLEKLAEQSSGLN